MRGSKPKTITYEEIAFVFVLNIFAISCYFLNNYLFALALNGLASGKPFSGALYTSCLIVAIVGFSAFLFSIFFALYLVLRDRLKGERTIDLV